MPKPSRPPMSSRRLISPTRRPSMSFRRRFRRQCSRSAESISSAAERLSRFKGRRRGDLSLPPLTVWKRPKRGAIQRPGKHSCPCATRERRFAAITLSRAYPNNLLENRSARVRGRLSWRPLSFQTKRQCCLLALNGQTNWARVCPLLEQHGATADKGRFWPAMVYLLLTHIGGSVDKNQTDNRQNQ